MLLFSQLPDAWWFVKHLYKWKAGKVNTEKIKTLDYLSFVCLEGILENQLALFLNNKKIML